jgi:NAD(P)-dependent dehydrogenase (short-subunit alcohol dehydrogenase family)
MPTVLMHRELAGDGLTVVSFDPGWNRTDVGGAAAPLDPADSVRSMVAILDRGRGVTAAPVLLWLAQGGRDVRDQAVGRTPRSDLAHPPAARGRLGGPVGFTAALPPQWFRV